MGDTAAGEFSKLEQVLVGENGLGIAPEAQNVGDNHAVLTVCFDLADVHVAQSIGLHGVDDLDGPAVVDEEREEGKPIVAGGLEANNGLAFVKGGERVQQGLKAFAGILKRKRTSRFFAGYLKESSLMVPLADIDTNEGRVHEQHLLSKV